ncbi:MAG: TRAP transporter small permease [Betaproteobacteria bacterium]|nr:TRAP transporter small permease [Betaproteobacteria bacterium]
MTQSPEPGNALLRGASRLLDFVIVACAMLAVTILVALVACVALEVVMRYFFNSPTRWVVEFSEYALLWLAFLGGAWVLREEGHVSVEMVVELLSSRTREMVHIATSLVGMVTCGLFCWVSAVFILGLYESGEVLFRSIQAKKWAVMSVMVPGLLLLCLQFMRRAWRGQPPRSQVDLVVGQSEASATSPPKPAH